LSSGTIEPPGAPERSPGLPWRRSAPPAAIHRVPSLAVARSCALTPSGRGVRSHDSPRRANTAPSLSTQSVPSPARAASATPASGFGPSTSFHVAPSKRDTNPSKIQASLAAPARTCGEALWWSSRFARSSPRIVEVVAPGCHSSSDGSPAQLRP
jgi:hypothetical protein